MRLPPQVINMFRGCRAEDMPPHIYACAQQAYRSMLSARADQAIVLSGRSGSGKSTNVRHLVHYFTVVAGSPNNLINGEALRCCRVGVCGAREPFYLL